MDILIDGFFEVNLAANERIFWEIVFGALWPQEEKEQEEGKNRKKMRKNVDHHRQIREQQAKEEACQTRHIGAFYSGLAKAAPLADALSKFQAGSGHAFLSSRDAEIEGAVLVVSLLTDFGWEACEQLGYKEIQYAPEPFNPSGEVAILRAVAPERRGGRNPK